MWRVCWRAGSRANPITHCHHMTSRLDLPSFIHLRHIRVTLSGPRSIRHNTHRHSARTSTRSLRYFNVEVKKGDMEDCQCMNYSNYCYFVIDITSNTGIVHPMNESGTSDVLLS